MLSEKIRNLAVALKSRCDDETLTVDVVRLAVNQLHGFAEDAKAMERSVPAVPALLPVKLPPNVVRLACKLDRSGVTLGLPPGDTAS